MKKLLFIIFLFLSLCALSFAQNELTELKVGDKATLKLDKILQAPVENISSVKELEGKVLLLEFWRTTCGPCLVAFKYLNQLKSKFGDSDFEIIAITYQSETIVQRRLKTFPINAWIGLDEDESLFLEYGIDGVPTTFLVDKSGIIVERTHPEAVTEEKIKELLAK